MITPKKLKFQLDLPKTQKDSWNVFGLNLLKKIKEETLFDNSGCLFISEGMSNYIKLPNINTKYYISNITYDNAPVYISRKQNIKIAGPKLGAGLQIEAFNPLEVQQIISDPDTLYTVFREGPYLLGKFSKNKNWAIIDLPDDDLFLENISEQYLLSLGDLSQRIIIEQKYTKNSPESLIIRETRNIENWQDANSPISKSWTINKSKIRFYECENDKKNYSSYDLNPSLHFSFDQDSKIDLEKIQRQEIKIASGIPFTNTVTEAYRSVISELEENYDVNNYGGTPIPSVLYSFNPQLKLSSEPNFAKGEFLILGNVMMGEDNSPMPIDRITINGRFINTKSVKSIIYGSKFIIDSVDIFPQDINLNSEQMKQYLDITASVLLKTISEYFTKWSRSGAFLVPPDLFSEYWALIMPKLVAQNTINTFVSMVDKKVMFNNIEARNFYDRLYKFMELGGSVV
jgi:hypothetical protein